MCGPPRTSPLSRLFYPLFGVPFLSLSRVSWFLLLTPFLPFLFASPPPPGRFPLAVKQVFPPGQLGDNHPVFCQFRTHLKIPPRIYLVQTFIRLAPPTLDPLMYDVSSPAPIVKAPLSFSYQRTLPEFHLISINSEQTTLQSDPSPPFSPSF